MSGVLDGVRVLDFGRYIAGPYCACLLGDLGAEVIRVERVGGGDDRFVLPLAGDEGGAMFLPLNRNKKSVTLDPATAEGKEIVRKLVATADVVVVNLPPQALASLELDYDSLKAIKPDIILTSLNAFGSKGPWSHKVGLDGIAQAMSGLCHMTGEPGSPMKAYGPWADFATATMGAFGTMAAILWRKQTGQGQHVEGSLLSSALVPAAALIAEQGVSNANRGPTANRSQTGAPADMFKTRDGWIIVQVVGQQLFKRWSRLIGEDSWLADDRFKDDASRAVHGEILSERMARWCIERTNAEALAELDKASLPAGPVLTPQEILDHEHVKAAETFKFVEYPGLPKPAPMLGTPVSLSKTPGEIRSRPPTIGQHTDAILVSLGYEAGQIDSLRRGGIV